MDKNIIRKESLWLIVFTVISLITLFQSIVEKTAWGQIYQFLFFLNVSFFILAVIVPKYFDFQNLNRRTVKHAILAGWVLGFALVASVLGEGYGFSIFSPLNAPVAELGLLGLVPMAAVFLLAVMPSELEETFINSFLRPTVAEWFSRPAAIKTFTLIGGILLFYLIPEFSLFGAGLVAFSLYSIFVNGKYSIMLSRQRKLHGYLSLGLVCAPIFAVLHLAAYEMQVGMITSLFLYVMVAGTINNYFKSSITSKIAHTMNNAVLACAALGLGFEVAFLVTGTHSVLLYALSEVRS